MSVINSKPFKNCMTSSEDMVQRLRVTGIIRGHLGSSSLALVLCSLVTARPNGTLCDCVGREAMRTIASLEEQHFERGNQAARVLKREKKISPATSRRLVGLATTYSVARHIDVVCAGTSCAIWNSSSELGSRTVNFQQKHTIMC